MGLLTSYIGRVCKRKRSSAACVFGRGAMGAPAPAAPVPPAAAAHTALGPKGISAQRPRSPAPPRCKHRCRLQCMSWTRKSPSSHPHGAQSTCAQPTPRVPWIRWARRMPRLMPGLLNHHCERLSHAPSAAPPRCSLPCLHSRTDQHKQRLPPATCAGPHLWERYNRPLAHAPLCAAGQAAGQQQHSHHQLQQSTCSVAPFPWQVHPLTLCR